jgi:hypothetical protein
LIAEAGCTTRRVSVVRLYRCSSGLTPNVLP